MQLSEQPLNLAVRQHRRYPDRTSWALKTVEPRKLTAKHLLVQEQQRGKRLVLSPCRHFAVQREVIQERSHFRLSQLCRVTLTAEVDIALYPMGIGFLSPLAVVTATDRFVDLHQQPGTICARCRFRRR